MDESAGHSRRGEWSEQTIRLRHDGTWSAFTAARGCHDGPLMCTVYFDFDGIAFLCCVIGLCDSEYVQITEL